MLLLFFQQGYYVVQSIALSPIRNLYTAVKVFLHILMQFHGIQKILTGLIVEILKEITNLAKKFDNIIVVMEPQELKTYWSAMETKSSKTSWFGDSI